MKNSHPTYPVKTIATLLLISDRRVQQLTKEGIIPKAERGKYHLAPTVQGYIRYLQSRTLGTATQSNTPEYHQEKARKIKAEADIAEMDAAKMAETLVLVDDVKHAWSELVTEVRTRLRNLPVRILPSIIGETNETRLKDVLLAEIDDALLAIANGDTIEPKRTYKSKK